MNCKTRMEKINEALDELRRVMKIIVITIVFTAIFALGVSVSLTLRENRELKNQIEQMNKENKKEEETRVRIVDTVTGRVIYEE